MLMVIGHFDDKITLSGLCAHNVMKSTKNHVFSI